MIVMEVGLNNKNMIKTKVKTSYATYLYQDGRIKTDLNELCEVLINWEDLPKNINDLKAQELGLLAANYKVLYNQKELNRKVD